MRAALHHIELALRIDIVALATGFVGAALRRIERAGPLPDIAGHVVQPKTVRREGIDGRGALKTVLGEVLKGKAPLPGVGHVAAFGIGGIAPRIGGALETAARGEFPLRFVGQFLAGPCRIRLRVLVGDVYGRMIVLAENRAVRSVRVTPVRAGHIGPPRAMVAQADRPRRLDEDERPRDEEFRSGVRIHFPRRHALGEGDVAGLGDEAGKFRIGHRKAVDPESVDGLAADRPLLAVERIRAHQKATAGNEDHVIPAGNRCGAAGRGRVDIGRSFWLRTAMRCDVFHGAAHLIRYANFFGTKSSGDPGGISSSFFTLFSKSRTIRWACCMTHQRT